MRGLGLGALALLRASAARLGARGPGAEAAGDAVGGACGGVAGARLLVVRARLAAERGLDMHAAALLRVGATRRGAGGPTAVGDAVDGAGEGVAGAGLTPVRAGLGPQVGQWFERWHGRSGPP